MVEAPFDAMVDQLESDDWPIIAEAGFDFDSESSLEGEHRFELKLNQTLRISPEVKAGAPKQRQQRNRQGQTYRKGSRIGEAVLKFSVGE